MSGAGVSGRAGVAEAALCQLRRYFSGTDASSLLKVPSSFV